VEGYHLSVAAIATHAFMAKDALEVLRMVRKMLTANLPDTIGSRLPARCDCSYPKGSSILKR
jgi:hypothetical protein